MPLIYTYPVVKHVAGQQITKKIGKKIHLSMQIFIYYTDVWIKMINTHLYPTYIHLSA